MSPEGPDNIHGKRIWKIKVKDFFCVTYIYGVYIYTVFCKGLGTHLRLHVNLLCLYKKTSQQHVIHFLKKAGKFDVFQTKLLNVAVFSCMK